MHMPLLLASAVLASSLFAQDAELVVNNTRTVRSTLQHPGTGNYYPYSPTVPPGYDSATPPGVAAGTRLWTHTPKLRAQQGHQGANYFTVTGILQSVRVGAAVATFPAPNHYQMKMGIAPSQPGQGPHHRTHAPSGADLLVVADAPVAIPNGPVFDISTTLATPVAIPDVDLLLFAEYRGGEYRDDPQGGQTMACDYYGGYGPGGLVYCGYTTGSNPRTVGLSSGSLFRPKLGFLVQEPILTATGYHSNSYISPPLASEFHRGLGACWADWATSTQGSLWFDVRAGNTYGSTGSAVVFLNGSVNWFAGKVPTPWGGLLLDPTDPFLTLFVGNVLTLSAGGVYNQGEANRVAIPTLGPTARGQFVKAQALVFNAGFANMALTSATTILIQ